MKLLLENWREYLKEEINDKTKESLLTLAFHHEEAEREMALSLAQSLGIDLVSLVRSELASSRIIVDLIGFHSYGWTDYGYHNDFEFKINIPASLANELKLKGSWKWSRLYYETDENFTDVEQDKILFGIANDFDGLSEKLKKDTGLPVELTNNRHFLKLISDEMKKDTAGL